MRCVLGSGGHILHSVGLQEVAWDEPPSTAEVEEMAKHLGLNLPAEADLLWIALEGELALVNR